MRQDVVPYGVKCAGVFLPMWKQRIVGESQPCVIANVLHRVVLNPSRAQSGMLDSSTVAQTAGITIA
jgi:hypothetical protein